MSAGPGYVIGRVFDDVRAAGNGAPVRALYEAAKHIGGHRILYGRLARSSAVADIPPLRPALHAPSSIPPRARARALQEAERILDGTLVLFGSEISMRGTPDWHARLDGAGSWPLEPWWQIDLRSNSRLGDVKWTWELARHRHLVVLARAAMTNPDENQWLKTLELHFDSWLEANPLEVGVHWASNLELSLRSIAWIQILGLIGDRLDSSIRSRMARVLWHTGHHLIAELPYTISTMANNHLLGDALGLIVIGRSFEHRLARQWARLGDWLFTRQATREFRSDGSTIDESLSYQRFVMEMVVIRSVLDGPTTQSLTGHLLRSANYLARLGAFVGPIPAYGDWDEGRVLAVSPKRRSTGRADVSGTALAALAIAGTGASAGDRAEHDELAWYVETGAPLIPEPPVEAGAVGGGIARASAQGVTVWLRGGERKWHGHADLGSVEVLDDDDWLISDPGTGHYNGDPRVRDGFRSSAAHSVIRVRGEDQLGPYRTFRWRHRGRAELGKPLELDQIVVLWCVHNAFVRLDPPRRVARAVLFDRRDGAFAVADWVEGSVGVPYDLTLPLGPGLGWEASRSTDSFGSILQPGGRRWHLEPPAPVVPIRGCHQPWAGWFSATYGSIVPATSLLVRGVTNGPVLWQATREPSARWRVDGTSIVGTSGSSKPSSEPSPIVDVQWSGSVIRLRVAQGRRKWTRTVAMDGR